jgi:putative transposase
MPRREPLTEPPAPALAELTALQREQAMARFAVLRPHLEQNVSLSRSAIAAGVPVRTAERWLARYRLGGLVGLARAPRADLGRGKAAAEVIETIEGLYLRKPRPSVATIRRRLLKVGKERHWTVPSYASIYRIIRRLDPGMVTLAHEGHAAYRDQFELLHRFRAPKPNAIWQADHTQLDLNILDAGGRPARPWLTTIIDDHSRVLAGYSVFLGAPSTLQTSLALRQAIWRKADPHWPVCGIPDVLYVDHGSDFTSQHLEQVAADLRFELIFSAVARPQGRGKVERLFSTLNTELLPELPGHLVHGKPATPPRLSLSQLDRELGGFLVGTYNTRVHREIRAVPRAAWLAEGWLPRLPSSLAALDLLLIRVAEERRVHRDGIHFQGMRYMDTTLAGFVGEAVTIRYDPRDMAEVRVFHRNSFLCRAISPEHSGQSITLKDIQAARISRRRALRGEINARTVSIADFLLTPPEPAAAKATRGSRNKMRAGKRKPALRTYFEDSR